MKKIIYFLISALFLMSCNKEEEESIDRSLLYGNWQKIEIENDVYSTYYLEFNSISYRTKRFYSGGSSISAFQDYKIEGNKIIANGNTVFEILYLSQDYLKISNPNMPTYDQFQEYKKP